MEQKIKDLFNDNVLEKALSFYNFNKDQIVNRAGFESFIFEIKNNEKEYILRVSHSNHRTKELIEAEIEFIYYLSKNNANVSTPILSTNNELVEKIDVFDGYFTTTLFTKAQGSLIRPERYSLEVFENLGEATANLHLLASKYEPNNKRYSYFEDPFILQSKDYIPKGKEHIIDKYNDLLNIIKKHPQTKQNYGLVHTDLHFGNMFMDDNNLITFFDFDDCMYTHYTFDIAIVFFYFIVFSYFGKPLEEKNQIFEKYYNAFMKGYNKLYEVKEEDKILIKYYAIARAYDLYAVFNRSFDVENNERAQAIIAYFLDVIENDTPLFDYNLIK